GIPERKSPTEVPRKRSTCSPEIYALEPGVWYGASAGSGSALPLTVMVSSTSGAVVADDWLGVPSLRDPACDGWPCAGDNMAEATNVVPKNAVILIWPDVRGNALSRYLDFM